MTIHVVALLFATLTLGVSSPRVSLHRWLLFTIRAQGKDGEEDLNKLSVINSNSCRNTVFFVIIIETFDFSFIIRYKDFHFYCSKTKFSFYLAFLDFLSEFSSGETFLLDLNCIFFFLAIYRITTIILTSSRSGKTRVLTVMKIL